MKDFLKFMAGLCAVVVLIVAGIYAWQNLRWTFASPLALAFHEQDMSGRSTASFSHAEVRKFIALDLNEADALAKLGGFDCKALTIATSQAVCYRDILQGLCKQLWRIQLIYGTDAKITRATASIRQTCWW